MPAAARYCERIDGLGFAGDYARALLADVGADPVLPLEHAPEHPAVTWARSGAMSLTGWANEPPRLCPTPLAACANGALMALTALTGQVFPSDLDGACLLGERAAIAGYGRNGSISPGGSCRFMRAADGWIALNLARPDDWRLLSALVQQDLQPDWPALVDAVRAQAVDLLIARGRELGLAIAQHGCPTGTNRWHQVLQENPKRPLRRRQFPLVIDLSSLWAGPLCGHLLHLAGARVIKVESIRRPDGGRFGPPTFYDLLNAGKESVALDFASGADRERLRTLIAAADIVIEASRPRALRQFGLSAEALVAENPGLVWVSITGYGRADDADNWIAFGDDAAVSAGLSALVSTPGEAPIFCGDAIADPLTGLHAAIAAYARWRGGAGALVSTAMRDVVGHCIDHGDLPSLEAAAVLTEGWQALLDARCISAAPPKARTARRQARPLGADTHLTLKELAAAC